jgi:hypothetical protein
MSAEKTSGFTDSPTEEQNGPKATEQTQSGSGRAWQASPSQRGHYDRNHSYHSESHKRTDLRTLDDHASWRQVYRHCHIDGGGRP